MSEKTQCYACQRMTENRLISDESIGGMICLQCAERKLNMLSAFKSQAIKHFNTAEDENDFRIKIQQLVLDYITETEDDSLMTSKKYLEEIEQKSINEVVEKMPWPEGVAREISDAANSQNKTAWTIIKSAVIVYLNGLKTAKKASKTPEYYGNKVTPWDLQKEMVTCGNVFIDARRSDIMEYAFRVGQKGDLQSSGVKDLNKVIHCAEVCIEEINKTLTV